MIKQTAAQTAALKNDLFVFSKFKTTWIYSTTKMLSSPTNKIVGFTVFVLAKDFDPEKYSKLSSAFATLYLANKLSPLKICEAFLAVFTTGKYLDLFRASDFDPRNAFIASPLSYIVRFFDPDTCSHIWNAMLLKKRIFVYSEDINEMQRFVRALPCFVSHRMDWDILRPFVFVSEELVPDTPMAADITQSNVMVAGTTDANVRSQDKLWDLLIDLPSLAIRISENAKADFVFTKMHKEIQKIISTYLEENGESNANDQLLIKAINSKNREIIAKLKSLQEEDGKVRLLQSIQSLNLSESLVRFLSSVAISENLAE